MHEVMKGIRVIELAQYVFVPAATAVLAEWGAEIIKVEPPRAGDAYRGLQEQFRPLQDPGLARVYTTASPRGLPGSGFGPSGCRSDQGKSRFCQGE